MTQLMIRATGAGSDTAILLPRLHLLVRMLGNYRNQQRQRERIITRSHDANPVYRRVPTRTWRRRSAVLEEILEKAERG